VAVLLLSGFAVLLLDQWTKNWALVETRNRRIDFGPVAIRHVAAQRKTLPPAILALVLAASLACAALLIRTGAWFQNPVALCALGVAFGGASGNLMDLARRRHVVDFIDLKWWPVFNIADVAIVGGLVIALLLRR